MKKSSITCVILLGALLSTVGCSSVKNKKSVKEIVNQTVVVTEDKEEYQIKAHKNENTNKIVSLQQSIDSYCAEYRIYSMQAISEEMLLIEYRNENDTKAVLFQVENGTVMKEISLKDSVGSLSVYAVDTNVLLYTDNLVYILDDKYDVNEQVEIDKIELLKRQTARRNYCVVPKEKNIYYYKEDIDENGVYTELSRCDYNGDKNEVLAKLYGPEKNCNYLNGFCSLFCSKEQTVLFFTGYYLENSDSGGQAKPCIGRYDIETGKFTVDHKSKESCNITSQGALFYDGEMEYAKQSTGKVVLMDEKEEKEIKLLHKEESQIIYASEYTENFYTYMAPEFSKELGGQVNGYGLKDGEKKISFTIKGNVEAFLVFEKQEMVMIQRANEKSGKYEIIIEKIGELNENEKEE